MFFLFALTVMFAVNDAAVSGQYFSGVYRDSGMITFKTLYEGNPLRIDCDDPNASPTWEIDVPFLKRYTHRNIFRYDDDYSDIEEINREYISIIPRYFRVQSQSQSNPNDIKFISKNFLYPDYMIMRTQNNNRSYSIIFRSIHIDAAGIYRCINSTSKDVISTTYISVLPNITESHDRFSRRGREGSDLVLFHIPESIQLKSIVYIPSDDDITDQKDAFLNERIKVFSKDNLHSVVITNLQLSDAGFYVSSQWNNLVVVFQVFVV